MVKLTPPPAGTYEPATGTDLQVETFAIGVERAALPTDRQKGVALDVQAIVIELNLDTG